jgi:imidazolonepropionase-like amidohydrolase
MHRTQESLLANTRRSFLAFVTLTLMACGQAPEQGNESSAARPAATAASAAAGSSMAFEGARLIIGDGLAPIDNGMFLVADGLFVGVGAAGSIPVPSGATRVDLTGMTVMPAIVDAHTHLGTTRDALVDDLRQRAYFGIGAAVSLGADDASVPLEMRAELIPGAARYRSAGLGITAPEPGRREVHWVTNADEARQAVRTEAARNVDLIKIWVDDRDGQFEKLSPAVYRAVIEEAHRSGLRTTAHIFALEDAKGLLRAGLDLFAHGVRDRDIDDEFVELVRQSPNVILVPNLPNRGVAQDLSWLAGALPAAELAALQAGAVDQPEAQEAFGIQARNLKRLSDEGMTIAFGTDGNVAWSPHIEMEDMVAAGMTPAEVIVAATRNAASAADIGVIGTLEAGKSADFIVLEANPLDDIRNTRKIASVYLRGAQVDRSRPN